jgi:hypothetical protein
VLRRDDVRPPLDDSGLSSNVGESLTLSVLCLPPIVDFTSFALKCWKYTSWNSNFPGKSVRSGTHDAHVTINTIDVASLDEKLGNK